MKDLKDRLEINIPDSSLQGFDCALMSQLQHALDEFDTRAMSDHALFLTGQKDMLRQVIEYLEVIF